MKEFAMKHPIITFLLVDGLLTGLFRTIQAFAPNGEKAEAEDEDEDEDKSESDPEEDLAQHISKEETK